MEVDPKPSTAVPDSPVRTTDHQVTAFQATVISRIPDAKEQPAEYAACRLISVTEELAQGRFCPPLDHP